MSGSSLLAAELRRQLNRLRYWAFGPRPKQKAGLNRPIRAITSEPGPRVCSCSCHHRLQPLELPPEPRGACSPVSHHGETMLRLLPSCLWDCSCFFLLSNVRFGSCGLLPRFRLKAGYVFILSL